MVKKITGKINHKTSGPTITRTSAKMLDITIPTKGRKTNKIIEIPIAITDNANKVIAIIAIGFLIFFSLIIKCIGASFPKYTFYSV